MTSSHPTAPSTPHGHRGGSLDVLVIENHRHAADEAITALEVAGHRVHRCYEPDSRGFPCRAMAELGSCPIDHGIDVTLVVRDRIEPRPTSFEVGVSCAGIPVVEKGTAALDPYGPWLTHRIEEGDDIADGVALAARQGLDDLRQDILTRIQTLIPETEHTPPIDCDFERDGPRLTVHLTGPALNNQTEQAIAVRVLDAIWHSNHTHGQVDVTYHTVAEAIS